MGERQAFVRARVTRGGTCIERAWPPTPHGLELVIEDAVRARGQSRVELMIPRGAPRDFVTTAIARLRRLVAMGIPVRILREAGDRLEVRQAPQDAA